jgi:hypothetical protein
MAEILVAVAALLGLGYQIGRVVSSERIDNLEDDLSHCETSRDSLGRELESLQAIQKPDTSLLCVNDADHFLDGHIVVHLQSITSHYNEQPRAQFVIEYAGTIWADTFTTSGQLRVHEFLYKRNSYGLYFLGYETKGLDVCARIMVKKLW